MGKVSDIQTILGVTADGIWGPKSQAALTSLVSPISNHGFATSFADPRDVARFRLKKSQGMSDEEAFKYGDNGIGKWGDDTTTGSGPCCAVSPDDMIEKWGSEDAAHLKPVNVTYGNTTVTCLVKDKMPWKKNITNGAIIDLNPDAVAALGLTVPVMDVVSWSWA